MSSKPSRSSSLSSSSSSVLFQFAKPRPAAARLRRRPGPLLWRRINGEAQEALAYLMNVIADPTGMKVEERERERRKIHAAEKKGST